MLLSNHSSVALACLATYGITPKRSLPMQSGYRNKNYPFELPDGTLINLILYKRESGMERTIRIAHHVGTHLHRAGFPARHTYDERILRIAGNPTEQFAGLYHYLPGVTIPWEAYTMKHLKSLGKAMSDMHTLLKGVPQTDIQPIWEVLVPLSNRMQTYLADSNIQRALASKLSLAVPVTTIENIKRTAIVSRHLPNNQPIHLDFVRSNILFSPDSAHISGVLDFEKVALGDTTIDIARTLAFLLVDCAHKSEEKIRKYFLYSGYNKYGSTHYQPRTISTTHGKSSLLELMIDFFLFHDFYKFLRHNPYESLEVNHHFVRTRDVLINRGVLATTISSAK